MDQGFLVSFPVFRKVQMMMKQEAKLNSSTFLGFWANRNHFFPH